MLIRLATASMITSRSWSGASVRMVREAASSCAATEGQPPRIGSSPPQPADFGFKCRRLWCHREFGGGRQRLGQSRLILLPRQLLGAELCEMGGHKLCVE